jgi:hypothetical protein
LWNNPDPIPVHPETVEGSFFVLAAAREARRKGQCFDKLSMDGFWGKLYSEEF